MIDPAILQELESIGRQADGDIDLADAALALAAVDHPDVPRAPYRDHLRDLAARATAAGGAATGGTDGRLAAMRRVLYDEMGYRGDQDNYDDPQNANLMRVIDRRKGLPVALGILVMHAARAMGFLVDGLNFPGHFLVRVAGEGRVRVLDPFQQAAEQGAAELDSLVQLALGPATELSSRHLRPVGNRGVLLRLQNNLKTRAVEAQDNDRAVILLRSMVAIAPEQAQCWRELGMLEAARDRLQSAVAALRRAEALSGDEGARREAAALLRQIQGQLN